MRTKGENIADNGGLKHSYAAYMRWAQTHDGKEKRIRLPGIIYSDNQLFFLNYAQIWCGHMNDQEAIRKLRTSEHSPGSIRCARHALNHRMLTRSHWTESKAH